MSFSDFQYQIVEPEQLSDTDWDKLTEMTHAAFKEHAERGLTMLSVSCSASLLKTRCLGNKLILAAAVNKIAGYYCYSIQPSTNKQNIFKCVTLAIHPNYKRRGLSRELHRLALEQARQHDCAYGILDTSCDAPSARAAHRAAGYKDWYYTHFPNANYYSVVMRIDLSEKLSVYQRYWALIQSRLKLHFKMNKMGKLRLPCRLYRKLCAVFHQKCNLPIGTGEQLRQLSLSETQKINFQLLQFFSDFCDKHGLRYLLCYGTLIGAIRHNGFIPWDDDVDVTMPLPDYYKFRELFQNEVSNSRYEILYNMKYNVGIPYTMLGDTRTLATMPGRDIGHSRPIAIDILPCYALSDDDEVAKKQIQDIALLARRSWNFLNYHHSSKVIRFIHRRFICNRKLAALLHQIEKALEAHAWGSTRRVRPMAFIHTAFTWMTPEDFDNYLIHPFEQGAFRVPRGYHKQLTDMYGNYMEFPPSDKRLPNYSSAFIRKELKDCTHP